MMAKLSLYPFLMFMLLTLLHLMTMPDSSTAASHFESYTVEIPVIYSRCHYYYCGYGWYYHWRYWYRRRTCGGCYNYYSYRTETRRRCQTGWTGPNCNIPVCQSACTDGKSCTAPNTCECLTAGQRQCVSEPCSSPSRSCYPGTCNSAANSCSCPPEFSGDNCLTINQLPDISRCSVKLFSGSPETEVAKADCAPFGFEPETKWVGKNTFTSIVAEWDAKYENAYRLPLPADTRHISDARIGVAQSSLSAYVNSMTTSPRSANCKNSNIEPEATKNCDRSSIRWSEYAIDQLKENDTIEISVTAKLGGFKKLQSSQLNEIFVGVNETTRRVRFKVDTQRPEHCRQTSSDCEDLPIVLRQDTVTNPVIRANFSNWNDSGSGIDRYHVEVYQLYKDPNDNTLRRPKDLRHPNDAMDIRPTENFNYQYTLWSSGVYSLELTVFDQVNNSAKARKIIFYADRNEITRTSTPLKVIEASPDSGYRWITEKQRNADGRLRLTVNWEGCFNNSNHVQNGWLERVEPWRDGIDDNLENRGNRTIHAVNHLNGIVGYQLAFVVDQQGGLGLTADGFPAHDNYTGPPVPPLQPGVWRDIVPDANQQILDMPFLNDNDTVIVWMRAFDFAGRYSEDMFKVNLDESPPELDTVPAMWHENEPDQYRTTIYILAHDKQSGIREVKYTVYDSTRKQNITSGVVTATKLIGDGKRSKRSPAVCSRGSSSCYCIPNGECFNNRIAVELDHCEIDRYYSPDFSMELRYSVVNQAGQPVAPTKPYRMVFASHPKCRPVTVFTTGTILAVVIGLLVLLVLVVLIVIMLFRWKNNEHPLPDRVRTMAKSVRQRVTNKENVYTADGNVIYRGRGNRKDDDDDDIYVDGRDVGGWRVNPDQVEMMETLAEGRFATVKKAYLTKGKDRQIVAAKYLPAGSCDADKTLLRAKIAFHGNRVPPHDNIVRMVGVLDDGPVMLLEYCDMTLKDWLSRVKVVDTDVLENMLKFTMHIASGMEYLHSKSIVHRRLAMRNVLLKEDKLNGLVAKLIGFGTFTEPSAEEGGAADEGGGGGGNQSAAAVVVPLKWLAPETLDSLEKGKPVYNQKTDVWAFGVTVWEIYSLGAVPYPGKKSAEVGSLLKNGYRLPSPSDCPPELFDGAVSPCWNAVAKKRPDFRSVCKAIKDFRSGHPGGGDGGDMYYAANTNACSGGAAGGGKYDNPKERRAQQQYASPKERVAGDDQELYDDARKC